MKMNSSASPSIDWSHFHSLPDKIDRSLDVVRLQKRLNKGTNNPLRWLQGSFSVPEDASDMARFRRTEQAVKTFVAVMTKHGWALRSKVKVLESLYPALELSDRPLNTKVKPGYKEYIVRAVFEKENMKIERIELPHSMLAAN